MTEENTAVVIKAPSIKGHEKKINEINARLGDLESKALNTNPTTQSESTDNTLLGRIERLEQCMAEMAHYNGGANERVLKAHGIEPYQLKRKDMTRMG